MSVSVTLPALGESVTEGTVTRWLKEVGDSVETDEPLLEVSTDKVDTEIPSPTAGTLLSITAAQDQTVEVGAELGVIGDSADERSAVSPARPAAPPAPAEATPAEPARAPAQPASSGHSTASEVSGGQSGPLPSSVADPQAAEGDSHADRLRDDATPTGPPSGSERSPNGTSVTLPELGESVTEGTVTRWLKEVGDPVDADEPLVEVSTDKVDTEIPAPVAGTLLSITAAEDATVEVGGELCVIGAADRTAAQGPAAPDTVAPDTGAPDTAPSDTAAPDTAAADTAAPAPTPESEQAAEPVRRVAPAPVAPDPADTAPSAATAPSTAADGGSPYVTPLVRKLAADSGVDLSSVTGTGVGGRIRKQDVQDAAEAVRAEAVRAESVRTESVRAEAERAETARTAPAPVPTTPEPTQSEPAPSEPTRTGGHPGSRPVAVQPSALRGTTEKLSRLRKVIATRMVESLQTTAQLTTVVDVDMTAIARLRQRAKASFEAREGVKLSFLPFFALATVEALKVMPRLNATLDTGAGLITYADAENLGIAVDSERGLLVPVITGAGDLNLAGLARRIADLAVRTRTNKLSPDELADGTFTLTNTGSRGALFDTPILNQPQVGILGTGAVVKRAVVLDAPGIGETIAVRSMAYLSLTYDHRLVDGADAARFLVAVKARLEEGAFDAEVGV